MELPDRRPSIDYPCVWSYQVIGSDEQRLRAAIAAAVGARQHSLRLTKRSASGRYCSLLLEVGVADEAERLALFESLASLQDARFVL